MSTQANLFYYWDDERAAIFSVDAARLLYQDFEPNNYLFVEEAYNFMVHQLQTPVDPEAVEKADLTAPPVIVPISDPEEIKRYIPLEQRLVTSIPRHILVIDGLEQVVKAHQLGITVLRCHWPANRAEIALFYISQAGLFRFAELVKQDRRPEAYALLDAHSDELVNQVKAYLPEKRAKSKGNDLTPAGKLEYAETMKKTALEALEAGLSVIPMVLVQRWRGDYGQPILANWREYMTRRPTRAEIEAWFAPDSEQVKLGAGVDAFGGNVSNHVELLKIEEDTISRFFNAAKQAGLMPLLNRIIAGYQQMTPSGGIQLVYFCPEIDEPYSQIWAFSNRMQKPVPDAVGFKDELRPWGDLYNPKDFEPFNQQAVSVIRDNCYFSLAPSKGYAANAKGGEYKLLSGGLNSIVTITKDERQSLLELSVSICYKKQVLTAMPELAGLTAEAVDRAIRETLTQPETRLMTW